MTFLRKNISLHPRLAAGLDLFLGLIFLWWVVRLNAWWMLLLWAVFRVGIWAILIRLVYFSSKIKRWSHFCSLVLFSAGSLMLLIFVEWSIIWDMVGAAFVAFSALSFWFLPTKEAELSFEFKLYRRWRFLLSVFGLMGIVSGFFALRTFQLFYGVNNFLWTISSAFICALVAWWWWREYGIEFSRRLFIYIGVIFLLMLQLIGVITFWPLGYLVNGLLIIWWWYVLWLLIRFHLSKEGIVWKKQYWFLATNFLAILLFLLLVVRWK
ncbi:MAG: hypothetical protein WCX97_00415 [Candidatus Magasanikbacteria bacterium]